MNWLKSLSKKELKRNKFHVKREHNIEKANAIGCTAADDLNYDAAMCLQAAIALLESANCHKEAKLLRQVR